MPKTLTAQSYVIEHQKTIVDENNDVVGYEVTYNVTYSNGAGVEVNVRETEDLWAIAPTGKKTQIRDIQALIKQSLDSTIL